MFGPGDDYQSGSDYWTTNDFFHCTDDPAG